MKNYLWNMFANIKNGCIARKPFILQPKKKICVSFLNVLWDDGFILGYRMDKTNLKMLKIFLKYRNKKPIINSLKIVTKPGQRKYYSIKQLWKIHSSKGVIVLSTNKGIMSINECKKLNLGGEPFIIIK